MSTIRGHHCCSLCVELLLPQMRTESTGNGHRACVPHLQHKRPPLLQPPHRMRFTLPLAVVAAAIEQHLEVRWRVRACHVNGTRGHHYHHLWVACIRCTATPLELSQRRSNNTFADCTAGGLSKMYQNDRYFTGLLESLKLIIPIMVRLRVHTNRKSFKSHGLPLTRPSIHDPSTSLFFRRDFRHFPASPKIFQHQLLPMSSTFPNIFQVQGLQFDAVRRRLGEWK